MSTSSKRGIVLMNLGSPDSTSVKDVRKYLNEFLMDARVIDIPYLSRLLLVKGIIVPFRAPKSAHAYSSIWTDEGSPLIVISRQLQAAMQSLIAEPIEIAMRYGNPSPQDAYDRLLQKMPDIEEMILVPLYPHYAMSSYETAVEYAREVYAKYKYPFKFRYIKPYYDHAAYIAALGESIRPYLADDTYDHILFSYHGVPEKHIYKGDVTGCHCLKTPDCCNTPSKAHEQCYRHQCLRTTELVAQYLQIPSERFSFSFQSRLGKDEWLKPYTAVRLEEMPGEGIKNLLVVCPAFVSDCLETLEEIAVEGKNTFLEAGGTSYQTIPCLNVHPQWVETLAKWVTDEEMIIE